MNDFIRATLFYWVILTIFILVSKVFGTDLLLSIASYGMYMGIYNMFSKKDK